MTTELACRLATQQVVVQPNRGNQLAAQIALDKQYQNKIISRWCQLDEFNVIPRKVCFDNLIIFP